MSGQLSFDDVPVTTVGSLRESGRPRERELLPVLQAVARAARRYRAAHPDLDAALVALDRLGDVPLRLPDNGTVTSRAAALRAAPSAGSRAARVLAEIAAAGECGLTDDELEQVTGWSHQAVSARRRDLVLGGHIVECGTRPTRSGAPANVWRAVRCR